MKRGRILITGSTGFVGRNVLQYLLKRGHSITCLIRPDSKDVNLAGFKIDRIHIDPSDIESLKKSLEGISNIVHVGGLTNTDKEEEYIRANVDYTYNLAVAFKESMVKERFIFISSQAAFGASPKNRAGNEEDICKPISAYGRSKLIAENKLKEFTQFFRIWILRAPSIYGPGDNILFNLWKSIQKEKPIRVIWDYPISMVYVLDLCSIISKIVENSFKIQENNLNLYFITDGEEYTYKVICRSIAKTLNKQVHYIQGVRKELIVKALINSLLGMISKRYDKDSWKLYRKYAYNVSCDKAKKELGYKPEYSLEKGIEQSIIWYKENGWL